MVIHIFKEKNSLFFRFTSSVSVHYQGGRKIINLHIIVIILKRISCSYTCHFAGFITSLEEETILVLIFFSCTQKLYTHQSMLLPFFFGNIGAEIS